MITKEFLHEKVARHLALRILNGDHSNLASESALGKELQVSRSIVRESIKVLEAKGLIGVGTKNGIRVRPRDDWNLLDPQLLRWQSEAEINRLLIVNLCELRNVFEPKAAELAALRATPAEIAEIRSAWEEMQMGGTNRQLSRKGDLRFHRAILDAAHNELLCQVARLTCAPLRISFSLMTSDFGRFFAPLSSHRAILDAIERRDSATARCHMEHVILAATMEYRKALDELGSGENVPAFGREEEAQCDLVSCCF
jgi:DNA-binding FadR family transcriptional regulator